MIAIGCLIPLVLFPLGAFLGVMIAGPDAAIWGAAIGVALGCLIVGVLGLVFRSALRRK